MKIVKGYKFRLKTNTNLNIVFSKIAGCCRFVYNHFLKQKIDLYDFNLMTLNYVDQANQLPDLKKKFVWLKETPSQTIQQSLKDLDQAYKNFFRRVAKGETPGFPKFKKRGFNDSFRFPQGVKIDGSRVFLPKIGYVKFYKSQEIEGKLKNTTVTREGKHWYIAFQVEYEKENPIHKSNSSIGIDMGIANFATLSTGKEYKPLNSFRKLENRLSVEQKKLSRKIKFSNNWKKQQRKVFKIHRKIADSRKDYLHQASTEISKNHAFVVLEDLKVSNMSKSVKGDIEKPGKNVKAKSGLNKSILDQGWYNFRKMLEYKLKWLGGSIKLINPQNTSRKCHVCGCIDKMNRQTQANFECQKCGHSENADLNAAKNILAAGLCRC